MAQLSRWTLLLVATIYLKNVKSFQFLNFLDRILTIFQTYLKNPNMVSYLSSNSGYGASF